MATLQFPSPNRKILPANIPLVSPFTGAQQPDNTLDRIRGSLIGLAVGDALGASVEFRPRQYLLDHPVTDMMSGGTWGLRAGQWTDDTSMALCLASSLITQKGYSSYDQMVRYKWWYKHGYLSSTGHCFDIGNATRNSLEEFSRRQKRVKRDLKLRTDHEVDQLSSEFMKQLQFDCNCSGLGVAGNGALMRLAPVPLFFYRVPDLAVELSGRSALLTHGDVTAVDACRYYGALIVAAVNGESKESLLSDQFYENHRDWFKSQVLHKDVLRIAAGSYKKRRGYEDGIRGKGHIIPALEAALWAFWSADSYAQGALDAVNLGDDTDTTAAIYGQLAGAFYGYRNIRPKWVQNLYADGLIVCIADWLHVLGYSDNPKRETEIASQHETSSTTAFQKPLSPKDRPARPTRTEVEKKSKRTYLKKRAKSTQQPHKSNLVSMPTRPPTAEDL